MKPPCHRIVVFVVVLLMTSLFEEHTAVRAQAAYPRAARWAWDAVRALDHPWWCNESPSWPQRYERRPWALVGGRTIGTASKANEMCHKFKVEGRW
jgi:hypothetical protein